ncbi:Transposable element tcb2 transposase [Caligus rogercresseyi]|uniref:Transposable element tcb2 transposase n=1 Tax=Caligus rogercresseyi TaxID=217165 RepID=A0A7T8GNW5_CALRO|nr:Transposable element tcb2 transposase [Caligus rogercresseyi]
MINNKQSSILKNELAGCEKKRISDLLDAEIEVVKIIDIVKCSWSLIFKVVKMKKDEEGLERQARSGGHNLKRTPEFLERLEKKIKEDPTKSINRLFNDFSVHSMTIKRTVREDLGLTSYTRTLRHLLTEDMKRKRLTRCKKVLTSLKGNSSIVKIFSDKKMFTVDQVYNRRNDRWLGETTEEVQGVYRTKHPAQTMVLGVVVSDGKKMLPFFFKIRKETYYKANYPEGNYVWTQNGAPSHTSELCQKFCTANVAHFWSKEMWPSSSPDLNSLDFAVWGELERKTNRTPHPNVDALKATIRTEWDNMSEEFLINSCKAFQRRVEAVFEAEGGHIE